MSFFVNTRIALRLSVLTALLAFLSIVISVVAFNGMTRLEEGLRTVYEDRAIPLVQLATVQDLLHRVRTNAVLAATSGDPSIVADLRRQNDTMVAKNNKTWADYTATYMTPEEKAIADRLAQRLQTYRLARDQVFALAEAGNREQAERVMREDAGPKFTDLMADLQSLSDLQARVAAEEYKKAQDTHDQVTLTNILLIVIGLTVSLGLAVIIVRSVTGPIGAMTRAMGDLAGGKLDITVPALGQRDEVGSMAQAVQVFKQNAVDKHRMEQEAEAARIAKAQADAEQRAREAAIVAEVAEVATAASEGDLERRIDLAGKDGFLLSLCEGVNNLVNLTGIALKDVAQVLSSVARGDLTQRITNQYGGLFGQLKGDVNQTADKLFEIVTNINSAAGQIG
ncbi:MAG: MCP four helix bundle domain-containing protein, partial [Rhodospirillaceae bacterium]|nr:MCP four helix bundle domain-containing protein [Rhodospirillales bacterium]